MENKGFITDCDATDIENPPQAQNDAKKPKFDKRNYLNTRLENGETYRVTKVRLLPISLDNNKVFAEALVHHLKVPYEVSASGFKSFICLDDPRVPGYNPDVKCPICAKARALMESAKSYNPKYVGKIVESMLAEAARMEASGDVAGAQAKRAEATERQQKIDENTSKALYKESKNLEPKTVYFARVIERGNEAEGVKFWRFNANSMADGVWDKLTNLWKLRRKEMAENDIDPAYNLFSVNNGRDINVTLQQKEEEQGEGAKKKKVTKTTITLTDVSFNSPLSKDVEVGNAWLSDEKKWSDCYAVKPPEYLAIVAEGKVPRFDNTRNAWYAVEPNVTGAQQTAQMAAETDQAVRQQPQQPQQYAQGPQQYAPQPSQAQPYAPQTPNYYPNQVTEAPQSEAVEDLPF